jgi:hypothetical protein
MIIRKAIKTQEKQHTLEEMKDAGAVGKKNPLGPTKTNFSFNKEETEEIMEKLMNRIVAKPNLIADDKLNEKI